ncbi:MAG: MATE family efflux transporter, partial [Eubacteriales bacterium]
AYYNRREKENQHLSVNFMELTSSKQNIFDVSPWRAITGLCIPSLISIVVMMLYNMADMYFVAWMNDLRQVAAVSLASPVFSILMAISTMIGNGGCTKIAQAMGAQDREALRRYTATGFWASIVFGLVFALACFVCITPLLGFLGATEDTWAYTRSYLLIMAAGAPIVLLNHSLGGMLRGEGLVKVGLASSMISTFANIALDPLFILTFKLGVAGAAIATVLGNAIATCYILLYRARHRDVCLLELRHAYAKELRILGAILALGLPNAISSILSGLAGTFSNRLLVGYGTAAIAAMAAAGKSVLIVTMVQMGICMGIQPLLAYCYGGRDWKKLKGIVLRLLLLTVSLGVGLTAVMWFARRSMVSLFLRDADAAELAVRVVGYLLLMGPFNGLYYLSTNFLQAAGNAPAASVASHCAKGFC